MVKDYLPLTVFILIRNSSNKNVICSLVTVSDHLCFISFFPRVQCPACFTFCSFLQICKKKCDFKYREKKLRNTEQKLPLEWNFNAYLWSH